MIKVLTAHIVGPFDVELQFSDHSQGIWRAASYLGRPHWPPAGQVARPGLFRPRLCGCWGAVLAEWPGVVTGSATRIGRGNLRCLKQQP